MNAGGSLHSECNVRPPMDKAAMPVGADRRISPGYWFSSHRMKVLFPVPAPPVTRMRLAPLSM
jgi:hypothetical protein